jgi:hypothetical protein
MDCTSSPIAGLLTEGRKRLGELRARRVFANSSKQMSRQPVPAVAKTGYE